MRHLILSAASTILLASLAGCSAEPLPAPDGGANVDGGGPAGDAGPSLPSTLGPAERPAGFVVPSAHDGVTPLPLMVLLHGYSASASIQDVYFLASQTARARGYYLILPDGTVDGSGNHFWNATPACCNFGGSTVDDVAYLTGLLDEAESLVPVDTTRVYFYGHSNGGFMSYRMACELSERVTAIVSLAGGDFLNETDCVPDQPVSVLQVHGTADATIAYNGSPGFPPARDTVLRWAGRAGCDVATTTVGTPLDLDTGLAGEETTSEQWSTGCEPGLDAELWTIDGGSHIPAFDRTWPGAVADWLLRHHR